MINRFDSFQTEEEGREAEVATTYQTRYDFYSIILQFIHEISTAIKIKFEIEFIFTSFVKFI